MANVQISPTMFDETVIPTSNNPGVSEDMFDDILGSSNQTEEQVEIESGEWLMEDNLSTAFAFLEGATLGWSDEFGAGMAAAGLSAATDETYDEAYSRLKAAYDARQKDFAKRQPAAAMGAEFAGAVVSPVSKIGAAGKAASTLGSMVGRGVAEGAVYGAGKAETAEEMYREGAQGALFGAVGAGVIGSAGWLFKRKIAAPLEKDGQFTPITLAADRGSPSEAFIQSFYKDVVGPSFGGKGLIRAQEEKVVAPLVQRQKESTAMLKGVVDAGKRETAEAKVALTAATKKVDSDAALSKLDATARKEASEQIIKGNYAPLLGSDGAVIARKASQIKKSMDNNSDALRLAAFAESVPLGAKKKDIAKILEADDPNIGQLRLEKLWQKEGFKSIKDISFRMKPEELLTEIEKKVTSDPTLTLLAGKSGVRTLVEDALAVLAVKRNPKTGRIKGEDLSAVRNSFGMAAAKFADEGEGALKKALYREIQGVVDKNMKSQLSGKRLTEFEGDVSAWAAQTVLRDAVTAASAKAGRKGRFTPDEYVAAIKRNSSLQARRGEGPLRAQAEELAAATANQKEVVTESANKLVKKLTARREKELMRVKNQNKAEQAATLKESTRLKKELSSNPAAAERLAVNMKRQDELTAEISDKAEELAKINTARTLESPTWYHQLAASSVIGALTGAGGGATGGWSAGLGAGALAFGTTVKAAKGLASEAAQKAIAGQSPTALKVQSLARKEIPMTGGMDVVEAVRGFGRGGAGMLTGLN